MSNSKNARPDNGPKLDVEIYMKLIDDMFGEGPVADIARKCRLALDEERWQDATLYAHQAWWMVQGGANMVLQSHRDIEPGAELEKLMLPWKVLDERAKIVLHNLTHLPKEMERWESASRSG